MVVSAASISTSFTPAASVLPIMLVGSIWISKWMPLFFSSTACGALASPWKPTSWAGFFRPVLLPLARLTTSLPPSMR
ncbi:hypothetical protein D3C80_1217860 [compost metagenome]